MDYSSLPVNELVRLCFQSGDESAWAEFVRRFHPVIARTAIRVGHQWGQTSPQVVDDLVQETYLKICSHRNEFLQDFTPTHENAFYGYLKVFTTNLVHDHFKRLRARKRADPASSSSWDGDLSSETHQSRDFDAQSAERSVLIGQIAASLKTIAVGTTAKRDFRIFWLYYRVGLSASAIAELPTIGLSTKGVESTLVRLTRHVRQRLLGNENREQASKQKGIPHIESL